MDMHSDEPLSKELSADKLQAVKDKLLEFLRCASVSRLKIHANCADVAVSSLPADFVPGRVLATHMAFILISGHPLRMTLKVHFNLKTARHLAYRLYGYDSEDEVSNSQAFDFFKEYCNLVGGMIVTQFEASNIDLGIGLPLCTRGFYEVFTDYQEKQYPIVTYSDFWHLAINEQAFYCSALIEVIDHKALECLIDFDVSSGAGSLGGMEFL